MSSGTRQLRSFDEKLLEDVSQGLLAITTDLPPGSELLGQGRRFCKPCGVMFRGKSFYLLDTSLNEKYSVLFTYYPEKRDDSSKAPTAITIGKFALTSINQILENTSDEERVGSLFKIPTFQVKSEGGGVPQVSCSSLNIYDYLRNREAYKRDEEEMIIDSEPLQGYELGRSCRIKLKGGVPQLERDPLQTVPKYFDKVTEKCVANLVGEEVSIGRQSPNVLCKIKGCTAFRPLNHSR